MKTPNPTLKLLLVFCLVSMLSLKTYTQQEESSMLFIYDASGSMWGKMDAKTKKEIAAHILTQTINRLDEVQKIGFMAYGHRNKSDCEDVELLIDLDNTDKARITSAVRGINPLGKTPKVFFLKD